MMDLLIEDDGYTSVAVFGMSEPDVVLALQQPWVSINNDSQGSALMGSWDRSILTPEPMARFRGFSANTCARKSGLLWKTPSGSSPHFRLSGCAWEIAAF